MRFNPKADISKGAVRDRGRSSGGGLGGGLGGGSGGRMPLPPGMKVGGGISGLILVVLFIVLASCLGGGLPGMDSATDSSDTGDNSDTTDRYAQCESGEDANESVDCARKAVAVSLQDYWAEALPDQADVEFHPAVINTFGGQTSTGCGAANSQVGPFYCPNDQQIYLDTTFFDEVFEQQLGGQDAPFVEPYVLAHEYGHHIQNLLGTMGKVRTQQGAGSDAVRLELQADCYAGMWAKAANSTDDGAGQGILTIDQADVTAALGAAATVGDDRIQRKTQGQVDAETWTHGSAEQRMKWFQTGFDSGTLKACDTFSASDLG